MQKTVFLILTVIAFFFSGCTGSSYGLFRIAPALINSNTHPRLKGNPTRGVSLSISPRSSLDIDVKCIFEAVQGESTPDATDDRHDPLNPWVRLTYFF